jgi:hypothetical protein
MEATLWSLFPCKLLSNSLAIIDAVGKFCNFDKEFGVPWELGIVLGSKCDSLTKVDQAAEHFMLHTRNHFLVGASDQRKAGGSKLVLMVSLLNRMKRDHKQAKTKEKFVEWFKDKTLMQQGLANHSLVLSTDGKAVCNEAIEELLLTSGVTTVDIWSCTTHWSTACAFETVRGHKSPLSYYISNRQGLERLQAHAQAAGAPAPAQYHQLGS